MRSPYELRERNHSDSLTFGVYFDLRLFASVHQMFFHDEIENDEEQEDQNEKSHLRS